MKHNLLNKHFGRLHVIQYQKKGANSQHYWICKCLCGSLRPIRTSDLINGNSKSCGCARKETVGNLNRKHSKAGTPIYNTWQNIKSRCSNKNRSDFERYGGRGIYVCDRWQNSFINFYNDMGNKPEGLTIERVDNNGPYSPDNCIWANRTAQNNNKRNNHIITIGGETKNLNQWIMFYGIATPTFKNRVKRGWSVIDAVSKPINHKHTPKTHRPQL